ncbi:MAG: hypothetical protein ABDI20_09470 [Candidatus Bipolaricaulaceae bacterium]
MDLESLKSTVEELSRRLEEARDELRRAEEKLRLVALVDPAAAEELEAARAKVTQLEQDYKAALQNLEKAEREKQQKETEERARAVAEAEKALPGAVRDYIALLHSLAEEIAKARAELKPIMDRVFGIELQVARAAERVLQLSKRSGHLTVSYTLNMDRALEELWLRQERPTLPPLSPEENEALREFVNLLAEGRGWFEWRPDSWRHITAVLEFPEVRARNEKIRRQTQELMARRRRQ